MVINYPTFLLACAAMRSLGIVCKHMPVAVNVLSGYVQPSRFHWAGPDTSEQAMIYGPLYHNDNVI